MVNEAYWNSATVNAHVALVGRMLFGVSLGFFFYDLILSFPFDWSIISGKRQRRLPQLAYFGTKFLLICFFVVNFVANFAYHEINCTLTLEMVEMVMGFTVVTSSILLACRTVCVFEGPTQKFVTFTLTILTCGLLAAWMADVDSVTIYWAQGQKDPWTDGACVQQKVSNSYWVKYVCTIIFDGIVLFLTVFGLLQMSGPSHIGAVLLRQGIIYFIITFIANLLITILTLLKLSPLMSLVIAIPQTTICVIAACRLYINLADEARSAHEASQQSYADRLRYSGGGGVAGGIETARPITTNNQSSTQSSGSRSKSRKARLTNYLFRKDGGVQETAVPSYFSSSSDPTNPNTATARTRNGGTTAAIPQHPLIREKENENSQGSSQETHNDQRVGQQRQQQQPQTQQKIAIVPSVQTMQNRLNLQNHQNNYPASTSAHPSDEDLEKQASRSNLSVNQTERFYDPPQTPSGVAGIQQGDDELTPQRGGSYFTQPTNNQQPQLTARIPPRNSSGVHYHQGQRLRTLPVSSVHQDDGVQVETVNYVVVEDAPAYTPPISQSHHQTRYASPRPYNPYDVNSSNRRQQQPQDDDEVVVHQAQQPRFAAVRREPPRT